MRKPLLVLMLTSIMYLLFFTGTAAASDLDFRASFSDITSNHWSYKDVIKMNIRGVVKGYNDSTFRPDKPVTQIEALLMAVNNMEGPTGVIIDETSGIIPLKVPNWVEEKCKKEVLFSIQQGLIIPSENNFDANAPASRAWVAKLVTRMIDKEKDALTITGSVPNITDSASVPAWANPYVNLTLKYKLLKGYPDKSFKPNQPVTRSEMVSILSRSEQFLKLNKVTRGKLLGVYDQSLFIVSGEAFKIYDLVSKTVIFNQDGKRADLQILAPGQPVSVVINDSFIDYLEVLPVSSTLITFRGNVAKTLPEERVLVARDDNRKVFTWTLSNDALIDSEAGDIKTLDQIKSGLPIEIGINGENQIVYIMLLNGSQTVPPTAPDEPAATPANGTIAGTIVNVNSVTRTISVLDDADNLLKTFEVYKRAEIYIDDTKENLSDIEQGMKIKIKLEDNQAVYLESSNKVSGIVKSIDKARNRITLKMTSTSRTFTFTDDTEINIEEKSNTDIDDINLQDYAELAIEDDEVTEINIRTMFNYQVIKAARGTGQIMVWDDSGSSKELTLDRFTTVIIPGLNAAEPDDLLVGDYITVTYFGSKPRNIEVNPVTRGKITQLDTSRNTLTVEGFNGKTVTYTFNSKCQIITGSGKSYSLNSLEVGNRLEITQTSAIGYEFKVMSKDSGKLQSLANNNTKISIIKDTSFLVNRYLASEISIHKNGQPQGISDLIPDVQVVGYSLNGIMYEVELR
ncbi:MAG TPA: S-layer homology domain-containing protein [Desulfobacteria bacterium]|nr:S-layer homology domain-containing protein [Desulfobacteria bacterium]